MTATNIRASQYAGVPSRFGASALFIALAFTTTDAAGIRASSNPASSAGAGHFFRSLSNRSRRRLCTWGRPARARRALSIFSRTSSDCLTSSGEDSSFWAIWACSSCHVATQVSYWGSSSFGTSCTDSIRRAPCPAAGFPFRRASSLRTATSLTPCFSKGALSSQAQVSGTVSL